ncbi:MAG TPA: hypothetical protein VEV44_03185 [Pseudoneobacillus sp.]|nr:hypothetical protein [Pseudoneobacillus sp.]
MKLIEKEIEQCMHQFILPFSLKKESIDETVSSLHNQGYKYFKLKDLRKETKYYGDSHVSHGDLVHYFPPFTNRILFPNSLDQTGFHRFSKSMNVSGRLLTELVNIPFQIHSLDVTLCPFELGFLTIRLEMISDSKITFSESIEFASRFRVLQPQSSSDVYVMVHFQDKSYNQVADFIFESLFPHLSEVIPFKETTYCNEFYPLLGTDRMFVQSFFQFDSNVNLEHVDVFRAGKLDGLDENGFPYVSANNASYMNRHLRENAFKRWAPKTYYLFEKQGFTCVSKDNKEITDKLKGQFYGEYYYGLLLNLFHKMVLLKIENDYSIIHIEQDVDDIEELIHRIHSFTANYYFVPLTNHSQGEDVFKEVRRKFMVETLYEDAQKTLINLYKYQEKTSSKNNNFLLVTLTLYTVIGGIFGMNLVIYDLKGDINWEKMWTYSVFEYIALIVTISGIIVSAILLTQNGLKWLNDKKKRRKWMTKTESTKKA